MGFPFLTVFLIFLVWLAFRLRKAQGSRQQKDDDFWARERAANATLAKDIDNLSYLTIPLDNFPLHFSEDSEVCAIEDELIELSSHRLLNLTNMTNTDLKEAYGVPNFETMSKIGEDFDRVSVLLNSYAKALIDANRTSDAVKVLEYAVGVKTDISESYTLLAGCYKELNNDTKLDYLKTQVEQSSLLMKSTILKSIEG